MAEETVFQRRVRLKAEAEGITPEEAERLIQEDIAARHRGDFSPQKLQEARDRERAALQAINNQQIIAEIMSCTSKRDVLNTMNKYHAYVIDGGRARIYREVNKYIQSLEVSAFRVGAPIKTFLSLQRIQTAKRKRRN
jgi:hypothetical protein